MLAEEAAQLRLSSIGRGLPLADIAAKEDIVCWLVWVSGGG